MKIQNSPLIKFFLLLLVYMVLTGSIYGQRIHFERQAQEDLPVGGQLKGIEQGMVVTADVDGDGDEDILITGLTVIGVDRKNEFVTLVYINDGCGGFIESENSNLMGLRQSNAAFADVDEDSDNDLIIIGRDQQNKSRSILYLNDGKGNFSQDNEQVFIGAREGKLAFADIDKDGDQDVVIAGYNSVNRKPETNLYLNDGKGNFTHQTEAGITGVQNSSVVFFDYDMDTDTDLIIAGFTGSEIVTELYENNGTGKYSKTNVTFEGTFRGEIAVSDIDNDQDPDLFFTGAKSAGRAGDLYRNNGNGTFSKIQETQFVPLTDSDADFADVDNDGDEDLIISGSNVINYITQLYVNDGNGIFNESSETINSTGVTSQTGIFQNIVLFSDLDNIAGKDLITISLNHMFKSVTRLYQNDNSGHYKELTGSPFLEVLQGDSAFEDIDKDGDKDLIVCGLDDSKQPSTMLYTNDGGGVFFPVQDHGITAVYKSNVVFNDVDNDGDNDFLITGQRENDYLATIYLNNGSGEFSQVENPELRGISNGDATFFDMDGDKDDDLLIVGHIGGNTPSATLYENVDNGLFQIVSGTAFNRTGNGSVSAADIDRDGDIDVLITGDSNSVIYKNDGSGNFSESTVLIDIRLSSAAFTDIDNDEDPDLLIIGFGSDHTSILYENDGNGNFTAVDDTPFRGVQRGDVIFSDLDNDKDDDVIITGYLFSETVGDIYLNDGAGRFTTFSQDFLTGSFNGNIAVADVNGDNLNDIMTTGDISYSEPSSLLLLNQTGLNQIIACDSFIWVDGITYMESNQIATYLLKDIHGCDSLARLDLIINYSTEGIDNQIACDSFEWIDGNIYTEDNNTATFLLVNAVGCDSLVHLDLTINRSTEGFDKAVSCDSFEWIDGNTYTEDNNTSTFTLQNSVGCDSLVHLDLTILHSTSSTDEQQACISFTWIDGNIYTESNNRATFITENTVGCDSVITLNLTISTVGTEVSQRDNILIAEATDASYQWLDCGNDNMPVPGATEKTFAVTEAGSYAVEITKSDGCSDVSDCIPVVITDIPESFNTRLNLSIHPNPGKGNFTIDLGNDVEKTIRVFDTTGKLVYKAERVRKTIYNFYIAESPGLYIVEVATENYLRRSRIILE